MLRQKRYTKEQGFQKALQYCGFQERSHAEVREKLYSFGLYKQQVEETLADLISEGCLNEERFAIAFARGKFKMKQWGCIKIRKYLKEKRVSEYCIKKGLELITGEEYRNTLAKLAKKKWSTLSKEKNIFIRLRKTQDYLLQKGYESHFIYEELKKLRMKSSGQE